MLAVDAVESFGYFFSRLSFSYTFFLSLGDGLIFTAVLSQKAVIRKTNNRNSKCFTDSGTSSSVPFLHQSSR